jgi:hypothetical protein
LHRVTLIAALKLKTPLPRVRWLTPLVKTCL